MLTMPARQLGNAERDAVERVLDAEPIAAAQVAERVSTAGLPRRSDARVLGYGGRRHLESICWLGGNIIPVLATPPAVGAFAEAAMAHPRTSSSLVGESEGVLGLWDHL